MLHQLIILLFAITSSYQLEFKQLRSAHNLRELNDATVRELAGLSDVQHIDEILDHILIPRVVGTENHTYVGEYISNELKKYGFDVEENVFKQKVPKFGNLQFRNIIGRLNPDAERYLVLACHYDSKYFKNIEFLGATDSAVPCAMLLNIAKTLKDKLSDIKDEQLSLMLLFLDGEEAFHQWTDTDSIYGARHLANKWHRQVESSSYGGKVNRLDRLDVFVLLDLIGTPDPVFFSYFSNTDSLYRQLSEAEDKLSDLGLLINYSPNYQQKYFQMFSRGSFVADDHVPFMRRGVPILHLIPSQFPDVWHTARDNRQIIDMNTVENLNRILRVFVAAYIHIN